MAGVCQPEKQALAIFHGLQAGRIDRTLLASNLSDQFTSKALADFRSSLAPLGEPLSFRQYSEQLSGGMTFRAIEIVYPGNRLTLTTCSYHGGKLQRYLVAPAE
jgi:D-alanyl-D-alanine carboxypeptidase